MISDVIISQSAAEMNILAQFTALVQNMLMYFFRKICFISATSEYELMQALKKKKTNPKPQSDQPHLSEQEIYLRD